MNMRKIFVVGAAIAALGVAAGAAIAQSPSQKAMVDTAKAEGVVGEQADGYLGFRVPAPNAELTIAVQTINTARRQLYTESAAAAGTTTEVAAARMFESQLLPRMTTGQWYRTTNGQWVRR
ncbi:YdbL family protein [uncultured Brevundimonas sp.]|uniref:YdbL family protein n=1 Tax=uncultured Brevundimonas sp. TaxID=213418 RepID=UPI0030ECD64D|tara:strand:- start:63993 stop:64355 length:363 start_codon:yes stop_codon:yes gene_type:complete